MCWENTPWCVLGTHLFLQCESAANDVLRLLDLTVFREGACLQIPLEARAFGARKTFHYH